VVALEKKNIAQLTQTTLSTQRVETCFYVLLWVTA